MRTATRRRGLDLFCCARAASGHAADPATTLMKSRRRIASPKAGTTPTRTRLQQGFATGGMGFRGQFAQQHSETAHVRFGSKADIGLGWRHVRFTPKSRHRSRRQQCPLCAKSGHATKTEPNQPCAMMARGSFRRFCSVRYRNKMRRRETERRLLAVLQIGAKQ
jgi:hypothetical protein